MSNVISKLQFSGQSGLTGYAVIRDMSADVWDGSDFVTFDGSDFDDYGIDMTEQGTSGHYTVDIPSTLPVGKYHVSYHHQAGASKAQTDKVIYQAIIDWDGTAVVDSLVIGSSVADICNMALAHLGSGKTITTLSSDTSEEGITLRTFYENCRDRVLRDFPWPFATRIASLSLVEEDPNDEWSYSYRYPNNALRAVRILAGVRNTAQDTKAPYRIVGDDSGRLIYCDSEDAELEYIKKEENPLRFTPDFVTALSFLLAATAAPKLTGGDPYKLGQRALEYYYIELNKAKMTAMNEESHEPPPDSEFIRVR